VCASHPNKSALYRQEAERLRIIAQQTALAQTKLLLLKAILHLEERAQDEERKAHKGRPQSPAREQ
jgi:formate dehydrogenase maturation protein FdhE